MVYDEIQLPRVTDPERLTIWIEFLKLWECCEGDGGDVFAENDEVAS